MSASVATVITVLLSLAGLYLLAQQDAKRRRAAGLEPAGSGQLRAYGYCLLLAPLPVLAFNGQTSPFILWLGILSVVGWFIALKKPS